MNEAVEKAHRDGILSAASLMVAGAAADHALATARRLPTLRVGLHLVLVDGCPVLPARQIPDLVDASGHLSPSQVRTALRFVLQPAVRRQFAREISAQFRAFHRSGFALDHVSVHEHFHLHPGLAGQLLSIGRAQGMTTLRVPHEPARVLSAIESLRSSPAIGLVAPWVAMLRWRARAGGLRIPDAVFGLRWSGQITSPRLEQLLRSLPPGLTEIYMHPATRDRFPGHATGYRYIEELAALTDPAVIAAARATGRRIGGYADAVL